MAWRRITPSLYKGDMPFASIRYFRISGTLPIASLLLAIALIQPVIPANGLTFGEIMNISNTEGSSKAPQIAAAENGNIYVLWQDTEVSPDILFAANTDPDNGFGDPVNVSNDFTPESGAKLAASNDNVFIVWFENDGEVYFTSGSVDDTGSVAFGGQTNLSDNPEASRNPQIASSGNSVYVVWEGDVDDSGMPDIFYSNSTDGGQSFGASVNLSNNDGSSRNPRIAVAESGNVYIAWQDDTPNPEIEEAIFVRASIDGGISFGEIAEANNPEGLANNPSIIPNGEAELYLLWQDASQDRDIFLAPGTIGTSDASITFGEFANVSDNSGDSTGGQSVVSGTGLVYVGWIDDFTGSNDVLIANSTDGGLTFSSPLVLSSSASVTPGSLQMAILPSNQEDLYLFWSDTNVGGGGDIFIAEIKDSGHSIRTPINLSNNEGISQKPAPTVFAENLYVAWQDASPNNNEILFRAISTAVGEPSNIIIERVSDTTPKWNITIHVNGTTNGVDSDTVTVDWGDGTSTANVTVSGNTWGPVSHSYGSSSVGPNEIIAKLLDSQGSVKATSSPSQVNVLKHATSLVIENSPNVVLQGDILGLTGVLNDQEDGTGIEGAAITFNGTGASGLIDAVADSNGTYSTEGPSPSSAGTLWNVQASFAGDSAYEASSSSIVTYDTASLSATRFTVPVGAPSVVELQGFDASISFDTIHEEGTLFISECETLDSLRYLPLGLCTTMSFTEDLLPDSFAHLTISYSNITLPNGHAVEEIDMFHEGAEGIVDITESRNPATGTVTGKIKTFSNFVVGVALHEPADGEVIRKQIFLGKNDVVFNDLPPRSMTFSDTQFAVGSIVTATVKDDAEDLDESTVQMITANITSSSDPEGILLTLTETGNDTALFSGTFTLVGSSSSSNKSHLHAEGGDTITGSYVPETGTTFRVIFDEVAESGLAELRKFVLDPTPDINQPLFDRIGNAYEVRFLDAKLALETNMEIIMSYADVDLNVGKEIFIDRFSVMQFDPDSPPSGAFVWIDITSDESGEPINTDEETVAGLTTFPSRFIIGHDVRNPPGGAGGGPVKSGVVVLDSVASVGNNEDSDGIDQSDNSRNGGGGGTRSSTISQLASGENVQTTNIVGSEYVGVKFDFVDSGNGQLRIETEDLAKLEETFEEVILRNGEEQGIVQIDGTRYSTAGTIFDIDGSALSFQGMLDVTIPYDDGIVLSSGAESDVRFLHYDEDQKKWADATIAIDTEKNSVTGELSSFSSVVAAVVDDGTFGETYFDHNPGNRIVMERVGSMAIDAATGEDTLITATIKNVQRFDQTFAYVVQLVDERGVAQHIDWQRGSLSKGEYLEVSTSWVPEEKGSYSALIFVWSNMDDPMLLSDSVYREILVSE